MWYKTLPGLCGLSTTVHDLGLHSFPFCWDLIFSEDIRKDLSRYPNYLHCFANFLRNQLDSLWERLNTRHHIQLSGPRAQQLRKAEGYSY